MTTSTTTTTTRPTVTLPASLLSKRQRYLQSLTPAEREKRLQDVVQRFESARATFEESPHLHEHRALASLCETIAGDVLETACALLGEEVFQAILDAAFVAEEGLFDPDDEAYLL